MEPTHIKDIKSYSIQHIELANLSKSHIQIYQYLVKYLGNSQCPKPLNYSYMEKHTKLKRNTIRKYIQDLKGKGLIETYRGTYNTQGQFKTTTYARLRLNYKKEKPA